MSKPTLLIDGDIVLFQIGRVTEDITDFGDEQMESYDMESALRLLESELDNIAKKTGFPREHMVFCLSSDSNFRKTFFPTYKGNRKNVKKPLGLKALREHCFEHKEKYETLFFPNCEADDVMGYFGSIDPDNIHIYSQDKDMFTIPCHQWDFKKNKFIRPTEIQSLRFLYEQVLTGDAVDGYKGLPRYGKIKSKRVVFPCNTELELLEAVHKLYFKRYKDKAKDMLLEQIGQARILHAEDYIRLINNMGTYNPYKLLGVTDEMLQMWEEDGDTK